MKKILLITFSIFLIAASIAAYTRLTVQHEPEDSSARVTRTPTRTPSRSPSPSSTPAQTVLHQVPFLSQAPLGGWSDPRQQDGCEEASVLMAMKWVKGEKFMSPQKGLEELLTLSRFGEKNYGTFHDTSTEDTAKFFDDYFNHENIKVSYDVSVNTIIGALRNNAIVIVPTNGRLLGNPNFTAPGPEYHMLVITGFDMRTRQFITNDPGTRQGSQYRYSYDRLFGAIADYETGQHIPREGIEQAMIIVSK